MLHRDFGSAAGFQGSPKSNRALQDPRLTGSVLGQAEAGPAQQAHTRAFI